MTPAEFAALGRLAWGTAWQRPMAAALGVSLDSVRSMSIGRVGIGANVAPQLVAAMLDRSNAIHLAAAKLHLAENTR